MRKLNTFLAILLTTVSCMGITLTDLQRSMLRNRTRLINQDTQTIDGYVINTFKKGDSVWMTTNKLSVINYKKAPRKISKIQLITNLKAIGKWDTVKLFIQQNGFWDEFNNCQFISTDYPLYEQAVDKAIKEGLATKEEIDSIISNSYDE